MLLDVYTEWSDQSRMTTTKMETNSESMKGLTEERGKHVYVVVENGELYPTLHSTYEKAHAAVQDKYADELSDEREEAASWGGKMASQVDVVENTDTGTTKLYIERGIHIIIQRYKLDTPM
jgi:hypothetical protein